MAIVRLGPASVMNRPRKPLPGGETSKRICPALGQMGCSDAAGVGQLLPPEDSVRIAMFRQ